MKYLLACLGSAWFALVSPLSAADWVERPVAYKVENVSFEGTIVYDADEDDARPGILLFPNWLGPATEGTLAKARRIAGDDYVVMIVDMYGTDSRPADASEAGSLAETLRSDRDTMRARAQKALEVFVGMADELPLKKKSIAAIGFCFGGGVALELGRTGADLDAIVSFHGDLLSPTLEEDAGNTKASVLVLHGALDPYVPQADVEAFITVMRETDVDWQLVQFSQAVHSFTDPNAKQPGQAHYHPRSAQRAFEMMEDLFDEIWDY